MSCDTSKDNKNEKKIYNCEKCKYNTTSPSSWIKHIESMKHARNGEKKPITCSVCDYVGYTHWNLRMHILIKHSTIEERRKNKYYCHDCDQIFFCPLYLKKHEESMKHKNIILAQELHKELYN